MVLLGAAGHGSGPGEAGPPHITRLFPLSRGSWLGKGGAFEHPQGQMRAVGSWEPQLTQREGVAAEMGD